jgi:hypothetical protein
VGSSRSSAHHWTIWQNAIERAFYVLTEKQQTVLRLHYGLDGVRLLTAEIAALLGVSTRAVDDFQSQALEKLARVYPDPLALLTPPSEDYYTPVEAAAVLGIKLDVMYAWVRRGLVQSFQSHEVGFVRGCNRRKDMCFFKTEVDTLAAARRQVREVA